jgi:hypothetical protein
MSFCVATIQLDAGLRAEHGIVRGAALCITHDAQANAVRLLAAAHASATLIVQQAEAQAAEIVLRSDQRGIDQMAQFVAAFDAQYAAFSEQSQALVVRLAVGLFDKLVTAVSPSERIEAVCRRLEHEAPAKLTEAVLHLHPADMAFAAASPWPCQADPSIAAGSALLCAASGEWRMDFSLAVTSLEAAFTQRACAHESG